MFPVSKQSIAKTIFPEICLIVFTLVYCLFCSYTWKENLFYTESTLITLIFAILFGTFESIVLCHVWIWCKPNDKDFMDLELAKHETVQPPKLLKGLALFVFCYFFSHAVCVLFGAPLVEDFFKTAVWAFLVATLISVPCFCMLGTDIQIWYKVVVCGMTSNIRERFVYIQSLGIIIGSWASAIVIPLDWDRPWQAWPIPCVLGCIVGFNIAVFINCVFTVIEMKTRKIH